MLGTFLEEVTCGQQSELYTKDTKESKATWEMCSNVPERPYVLPFMVSHRRHMNVLGRKAKRDAQDATTLSSPRIAEGHVFGKGKGL